VRHASFFSGVGGLDLGFERAGIKTVSVSEIDPYANAVLAERFPDAPNLESITEVEANDIPDADIWSGGFPCQDLSVAGKRAGFGGKRSSLAFTFLDLVEQRRPRWLVLENVPGLFSSNRGADFGRLLSEVDQLGYGVAWRTLDARYFGVAQRRRRVFLVASLGTDRAGEVLFECEGCERHPSPRKSQGQETPAIAPDGSGIAGALTRRFSKGVNSTIDEPLIVANTITASLGHHGRSSPRGDGSDNLIVNPEAHSDGVRKADGLARRLDNQPAVARKSSFGNYEMTEQAGTLKSSGGDIGGGSENIAMTLTSPQGGGRRDKIPVTILSFPSRFGSNANATEDQAQSMAHSAGAPAVFRKRALAQTNEDSETWVEGDYANTLNSFDVGDTRTTDAVIGGGSHEDPLLPLGLDSHRYRCAGNGVVAPVAEWIGHRIVEVDRRWREEAQ
jgi:site-specific DNA-cytosine methylase